MSTLKVNKLENTTTTDGGITIDNTGSTIVSDLTVGGEQLSTGGTIANRNLIVNGAMKVQQRYDVSGFSNTVQTTAGGARSGGGYHDVDRWGVDFVAVDGSSSFGLTHAAGSVGDSDRTTTGMSYSCKTTVTTAQSSLLADTLLHAHQYKIEGQDLIHLQWGGLLAKSLTLSFWVRVSKPGTYCVNFNHTAMYSGVTEEYQITRTFNISNTDVNVWRHKTVTIPGDTTNITNTGTSTGLTVSWVGAAGSNTTSTDSTSGWADTTGTAGTGGKAYGQTVDMSTDVNSYYEITGVQLEAGTKNTPFEHRSYADELHKCYRYYYAANITNAGSRFGNGYAYDTNSFELDVAMPVHMRVRPTAVETSGTNSDYTAHMGATGVKTANSQPTLINSNNHQVTVRCDFPSSSFSTGAGGSFRASNTNAFLGFSAEL